LLRNLAYLAEACVACRWLEGCNCTHIHAHFATNSTAVAMLCHQLGGLTYSFTVHGPEEFDKNQRIALTEKIERAAFVVAISSFGRSQLFRWCAAVHWQKIHIVRCGVDRRFLDAPLVPVPDTQRLVCVGRLCEQKGQLLLIEAVARLIQEGIDIELVLAGDGEMRSAVEKAIAGHGIAEHVRITGWLSSEQILGELRGARGLVLPSFAEGLPVVIMEALALCRPVLSTYVAGIPELIEPGQNGWLVPAGSVDALVDALRQMLVVPTDRLTSMGKKGRQRVLEAHDARTSALQLEALFSQYG
jgi:glycosyltransferase involved in cell wall biosynthesis